MNISYTKIGNYELPNLKIVDKNYKENLNKYGLLRLSFIKNDIKLSEKFKGKDSLQWTKLMNNYKNIAEEIVLNDYIYE